MCLSGIISICGNLLVTQAYRLTPASKVAPFEYTGLVWAPIWGLMMFAEVPGLTSTLGLGLIVLAGVLALAPRRKDA